MDYNGSVESASPNIKALLYDPSGLIKNKIFCMAWPLLKNESTRWNSREERYEYLVSCANTGYESEIKLVNLEKTNVLSLMVLEK